MIKYYLLAIYKIAKVIAFQLLKSMVIYIPLIGLAHFKGVVTPLYMYFSLGIACLGIYTIIEGLIEILRMYAKSLKEDAEKIAKLS